MPESIPGAVISFPMLGESFSVNPPSTYTLFGHTFYWYGAIIGLGFVLAVLYCMHRGERDFGITRDNVTDIVLIGLPAGIVGARLYYVLCNWSHFAADTLPATLWNICKIWEGGTAIPGGLVLAVLCLWLYARKKKLSFGAVLDILCFGLLIGQVIGRWSNFVNREAFGVETDIFCRMGLTKNGQTWYVHPLFLYESLWNLLGLILLHIWSKRGGRKYDGQAFLLYTAWYGFIRFCLEGIRTGPLLIPGTQLRASQVLMGTCCGVAVILLIVLGRREHSPDQLWVNRRVAASSGTPCDSASPAPGPGGASNINQ